VLTGESRSCKCSGEDGYYHSLPKSSVSDVDVSGQCEVYAEYKCPIRRYRAITSDRKCRGGQGRGGQGEKEEGQQLHLVIEKKTPQCMSNW